MMSDPTTVDRTTVDELTGKLVLLIEEPRAWDQPALMHRQLAAKVKNYVRHIRSPEHRRPPSETIVRLVSAQSPGAGSLEFFARVSYELSKHDIAFEHQVGEDGLPVPIAPEGPVEQPTASPAAPPEPPPGRAPRQAPSEPPAPPEEAAARIDAPVPESDVEPAVEPESADEVAPEPDADWEPEVELEPDAEREPADEVAPGADLQAHPDFEHPAGEGWLPDFGESGGFDLLEDDAAETAEADPHLPDVPESSTEEAAETLGAKDMELEDWGAEITEAEDPEQAAELVDRLESLARPAEERPKYPPFFPEEEFGRDVPEIELRVGEDADEEDEVAVGVDLDSAIIETPSGKRIALDGADTSAGRDIDRADRRASPIRALGSALVSAAAGAVVWGLLSLPANQGAGLLAPAVAVMVGMSVRLRGGHSVWYRVVAGVSTLFGIILGSIFATLALTAKHSGGGLGTLATLVSDPGALLDAALTYFGFIDAGFAAVALYIAVRISIPKS